MMILAVFFAIGGLLSGQVGKADRGHGKQLIAVGKKDLPCKLVEDFKS